jgi:hypothetical protein
LKKIKIIKKEKENVEIKLKEEKVENIPPPPILNFTNKSTKKLTPEISEEPQNETSSFAPPPPPPIFQMNEIPTTTIKKNIKQENPKSNQENVSIVQKTVPTNIQDMILKKSFTLKKVEGNRSPGGTIQVNKNKKEVQNESKNGSILSMLQKKFEMVTTNESDEDTNNSFDVSPIKKKDVAMKNLTDILNDFEV